MDKLKLNILAPTRYPWTFNGPRHSRHNIHRRSFIPFNKISYKIEGVTVLNPFPLGRIDLIHAFNRIPLGSAPYIIGFESHLPRAFGMEDSKYFEMLCRSLAGERCRGIFAISEYARRHFIHQHQGRPWFNDVVSKLHVRYPNMPIPVGGDMYDGNISRINLIFIGNHFARKGGIAVLKLAQLARDQGFPIHIDIISSLQIGDMSWVDPLTPHYFDTYKSLLNGMDNITVHGALPNTKVLELLRKSHFSLLPTFSDTFGFSAIESMVNFVPVMATAQGALPEFITDGENGILLPLETNQIGEWAHTRQHDRTTKAYAEFFDAESDRIAKLMLDHLRATMNNPDAYLSMRQNARTKAVELFSADDANIFWDDIYSSAV